MNSDFLGRGWSFPPEFIRSDQSGVKMLHGEPDIESSLMVLLMTKLGERVMVPNYGCNLEDLMFENIDLTTKTYVKDLILTAILYHEPRIEVEKLSIDTINEYEGMVKIVIYYRIRATNSRKNFVFPYYKTEATNI